MILEIVYILLVISLKKIVDPGFYYNNYKYCITLTYKLQNIKLEIT